MAVTALSAPDDLTGLGIKMDEYLSARVDADGPTVVCIDSLSTLLQYVGTKQAFRFLYTFLVRIATDDITIVAHGDPTSHEEQTLTTIRVLLDAVIERDSNRN